MEGLTQWATIPTPEDLASSLEDAPPRYRESCIEVAAKIEFMADIHKFVTSIHTSYYTVPTYSNLIDFIVFSQLQS